MVVESKQFLDMPLTMSGQMRTPRRFMKLSPGVAPSGTWTRSISGGGGFQDQIYYDGIALSRGDQSQDDEVTPSVEAIAEFKLITNNYSAEYAHAMGGITSYTMKSGTNDLHGQGLYSDPQRKARCTQLLRDHAPALKDERVGRHDRRPGGYPEALQRQGQDVLVLLLRPVLPPRRAGLEPLDPSDGEDAAAAISANSPCHLRSVHHGASREWNGHADSRSRTTSSR